MQSPLPAPTASGALLKTPFPHLLIYALERRLTGTFELSTSATMLVVDGCPAKVRTNDSRHWLGTLMHELRLISKEQLGAALARMQERPRLLGQILVEMGAIDPPRLDGALRAQVERKVEHLFTLPNETTFAYYDGIDLLEHVGGAPTPIDPLPVLWRGVRQQPPWEHVDATLRRVGGALLRTPEATRLERFAFDAEELHLISLLRERPTRAFDVPNTVRGNVSGQVLVYFLMITKQIELLDASAPAASPAPEPPPASPTSSRNHAVAPPPASGQAFARVQLQRQPRTPLVVEEHIALSGGRDDRTSTPGIHASGAVAEPIPESRLTGFLAPGAPGTTPPLSIPPPEIHEAEATGEPTDIGSMIVETIRSSMPPPISESDVPSVPAPAENVVVTNSSPPASLPPDALGAKELSVEHDVLKAKILERADQITSQDYFQMLDVDRDASTETIQKAFFALARVWHPDRLPPALATVKDACSKVFTHLTEAHATLTDTSKRQDYMTLLKDGGATPDDQAKIQAILEAATEFQKAEFLLRRTPSDTQAYEIVKRCVSLDPEQSDYLATLAWLDAQKPAFLTREKTLAQCLILDSCIRRSPKCERAYFYRGLLYKRANEGAKALKDFKRAAELNPRNLDAVREVRIFNMRGGGSKPPPATTPGPGRSSKPPPAETIGGLFGRLFKKK